MKALTDLTPRQIRICVAAIEWYEKYGTAVPMKHLQMVAYGRARNIISRDVRVCIEAGVLLMPHGIHSLRPAPAFRLPFKDEAGMRPENRGHLVPVLRHMASEQAAAE